MTETQMPIVSVITTFLDAEEFIEAAVESVLAQTYEEWELVLVDDGSSDRSTAIAKRFAERHPARIRYLEHDEHRNQGLSASRNLGIKAARGDFIAFLDADDVWLAGKLAKQMGVLDVYSDIGLIFSPALYWHEDGTQNLQPVAVSEGRLPSSTAWIALMLRSDDNAACPSTVLMKREIALALGGFEESFRGPYQIYEDQVMWCKVSMSYHIYYDPEPMVLYRVHPASLCGSASDADRLLARIGFYSWLRTYLRTLGNYGLLAAMTQCRLVEALVQASRPLDRQDGIQYVSRIRRRVQLVSAHRGQLGGVFSGLMMIGAVSNLLALALSRSTFVICDAAHGAVDSA